MLRSFFLSLAVYSLTACAAEPPVVSDAAYGQPIAPSPEPAAGQQRVTFTNCHVEGPYVAITFDDGPNPTQTPRLLKMLKDRGIKATFFCLGECVAHSPEIAQQIVREGHEIENHSWSHPQLSKMSEAAVRDQIDRTQNVIRQTTGVTPTMLRPPYGALTVRQRTWANVTWGCKIILWDVDSLDWKHRSPAKTESIIMSETKKGSIILCHDIHKTTVDAMPATLDALIAKGFKFVTVAELLKMHREPVPQKKGQAAKSATVKDAPAVAVTAGKVQKPSSPAGDPPTSAPGGPAPQ